MFIKIHTKKSYKSVVAIKRINKDSKIFTFSGDVLDVPTRTSIQLPFGGHLENKIAGCINHSCNPNIEFHFKYLYYPLTRPQITCIAAQDIKLGEEIRFDYNTTEDILSHPFKCTCCNKMIQGKKLKYHSGCIVYYNNKNYELLWEVENGYWWLHPVNHIKNINEPLKIHEEKFVSAL